MPIEPQAPRLTGGALNSAISAAVVGLLREYTGRGPTKARTSIRDDLVVVLVEDTLTKGEQSLVRSGREATVLGIRHEFQEAMRADCINTIEGLTGRSVLAMMSADHVDPDLGAELFLLGAAPSPAPATG